MSDDKIIKVTEYGSKKGNEKNGAKIDIYSNDPKNPHDSIHVKVDTDKKTFEVVTKVNGEKESGSGGCFLTTACMEHQKELFDDNCEELTILRWFRDSFVDREDIEHYYVTAPIIVDAINQKEDSNQIYQSIYYVIVKACVEAIKRGDYDFAYQRYKEGTLQLEEIYARPYLESKLVMTLKRK